MKRILRSFLIEIGTLYLITQFTSGLQFANGVESLAIAGVALTIATFIVRPVINILLLPINLITFGLFKWISQAITLYIVDLALPQFNVGLFGFSGFSSEWVFIPSLQAPNIVLSYIAFSLLLSIIGGVIYWLAK